jgi:hypothetical protein
MLYPHEEGALARGHETFWEAGEYDPEEPKDVRGDQDGCVVR